MNVPFVPVPSYCEENVWMLLNSLDGAALSAAHALFVSNADRTVAFLNQKNGGGGPVVWDYHVVALLDAPGRRVAVDFNCAAGERLDLNAWLAASFGGLDVPDFYRPLFKPVPAPLFLERFRSDRSHMLAEDGSYLATPPPWPAIRGGAGEGGTTLDRFVDAADAEFGIARSQREFRDLWTPPSPGP